MSFCPQCRAEYRRDISRCPECDVDLVDELSPAPELAWDPREWVTVDESGDESEARILEGFLAEAGLPVRLRRHGDRAFPTSHGGLSRFEVQVPAEELGRAIDLLERIDESGHPEEEGDGPAGGGAG